MDGPVLLLSGRGTYDLAEDDTNLYAYSSASAKIKDGASKDQLRSWRLWLHIFHEYRN